jgi:hypothetical protein
VFPWIPCPFPTDADCLGPDVAAGGACRRAKCAAPREAWRPQQKADSTQGCYKQKVDQLHSRLTAGGAPAGLLRWSASCSPEDAWNGCDKGGWLIWMAACSNLPIDALLRVGLACVDRALLRLDGPVAKQLRIALDDVAERDVQACSHAAHLGKALASAPPSSYRSSTTDHHLAAAKATAWIARATEAFVAAHARDEASRAQLALQRATSHGVPPAMMMPPASALVWLPHAMPHEPLHDALGFVVDAVAQAVTQSARATASRPDAQAVEQAELELADLVHDALNPLLQEHAGS